MHKQFKKETPQGGSTLFNSRAFCLIFSILGVINRKEFRDVMKAMGVADTFLQDLIFNVVRKDGFFVLFFSSRGCAAFFFFFIV